MIFHNKARCCSPLSKKASCYISDSGFSSILINCLHYYLSTLYWISFLLKKESISSWRWTILATFSHVQPLQRSASWELRSKPFLCTCSQCSHARDVFMEGKQEVDMCSSKAEISDSLPMAFIPLQRNRGVLFPLRGVENRKWEVIQP